MIGSLVISLDFELMWGVRDHETIATYGSAVMGGRRAIPQILRRFEAAGVRATWATVGLLFARSRAEMIDYSPTVKPAYDDEMLSPYSAIENEIGNNEAVDPLHFGWSLVKQISETEGQEIGTHSFSHYYCLEPGQSIAEFDADLQAALEIARHNGIRPRSIVFPRNQMADEHLDVCRVHGLTTYRGNPNTFGYRARSSDELTTIVRGFRLLDGILPLSERTSFRPAIQPLPVNVCASRFLRPYWRRAPAYSRFHIHRIMGEMEAAARNGEVYHLWWHPHNFGRDVETNLQQLDKLILHFRSLSDSFGMQSRCMSDFVDRAVETMSEDHSK